MNVNSVVIVGRLTGDPEMRYTEAGKAICKMTVAVNKPWHREGEPAAEFFEVRAFNKQAETAAQHLVKGQEVGIQGRMESRTYEKNGQRRKIWELLALHIDFGSKPRNQSGQPQRQEQASDGGDDFDDEPSPFL